MKNRVTILWFQFWIVCSSLHLLRNIVSGEVCGPGQWQCANERCINVQWVCDTSDDCGDRSDESVCDNSCVDKHGQRYKLGHLYVEKSDIWGRGFPMRCGQLGEWTQIKGCVISGRFIQLNEYFVDERPDGKIKLWGQCIQTAKPIAADIIKIAIKYMGCVDENGNKVKGKQPFSYDGFWWRCFRDEADLKMANPEPHIIGCINPNHGIIANGEQWSILASAAEKVTVTYKCVIRTDDTATFIPLSCNFKLSWNIELNIVPGCYTAKNSTVYYCQRLWDDTVNAGTLPNAPVSEIDVRKMMLTECAGGAEVPRTLSDEPPERVFDVGLSLMDTHTRACDDQEYQCKNRKCVRKAWLCDGDNDCLDNSDEEPIHCALDGKPPKCGAGYFKCSNGNCVKLGWICDGTNDCGDNSDEPQICRFVCTSKLGEHFANGSVFRDMDQLGDGTLKICRNGQAEILKDFCVIAGAVVPSQATFRSLQIKKHGWGLCETRIKSLTPFFHVQGCLDNLGNAVFPDHQFSSENMQFNCVKSTDVKSSKKYGMTVTKSVKNVIQACVSDNGEEIAANGTSVTTSQKNEASVIYRCSVDSVHNQGRFFAEECRFRNLNASLIPGCYIADSQRLFVCKPRNDNLYSADALQLDRTLYNIQTVQAMKVLNCESI